MQTAAQNAIAAFKQLISDPNGRYLKTAYHSFARGQDVFYAHVARVALEYKVDPQLLVDAAMEDHVAALLGTGTRAIDTVINKY